MQNVNGGRCAGPDCSKQPRFSLPGEKGKYCSKHREEGMVDVLYTVRMGKRNTKHRNNSSEILNNDTLTIRSICFFIAGFSMHENESSNNTAVRVRLRCEERNRGPKGRGIRPVSLRAPIIPCRGRYNTEYFQII